MPNATTSTTAHDRSMLNASPPTLGSMAGWLWGRPDKIPLGLELSCSHHRAATEGQVTGVCTPLHRGRTTMVWQTRITRGDGRLCAIVTQTQMVLEKKD